MDADERMLKELGIESVDELFADLPPSVRTGGIDLPPGRSEMEVIQQTTSLLSTNLTADRTPSFLGAGVYHHFIPSAVTSIIARSEFLTAYTPYQAEISQGMLQALFEYQSLMAELTGMEAVNSSNYDAFTALGEAAIMCHRINQKRRFLVPEAINSEKLSVLSNYVRGLGMEIVQYGFDLESGEIDLEDLKAKTTDDTAGIYVEMPSFLGIIDRLIPEIQHEVKGPALVVGVNPISLGLLRPPADYGADIVIGEGQPLGSLMSFGGPQLGIFATRSEHVRKMPGRVVGLTRDEEGKRAFCLTLQTREQHVRREKATSNICTNEALMAIAAAVYMAVVGREGLRELAALNIERARMVMRAVGKLKGFEAPAFSGYHFNEFVMRPPVRPEKLNKVLLKAGIIGGLPLAKHLPALGDCMLMAATELTTDEDIRRLVAVLEGIA